jgi:molybdate transport system regulatory protein
VTDRNPLGNCSGARRRRRQVRSWLRSIGGRYRLRHLSQEKKYRGTPRIRRLRCLRDFSLTMTGIRLSPNRSGAADHSPRTDSFNWMISAPDRKLSCRFRPYHMLRHSGLGWVPLESGMVAMTSSRLSIRIVLANGRKLGPAKIALLEAIAAHGSISGAARSLGISYRGAWQSLQTINSMLCGPAVATDIGGRRRGGAVRRLASVLLHFTARSRTARKVRLLTNFTY